jgi:hypothetical protein
VEPSGILGQAGVIGNVGGNTLTNYGLIIAGQGTLGYVQGYYSASPGKYFHHVIQGGAAGDGVDLASAVFGNSGTISGGTGGSNGGLGGIGVNLSDSTAINAGLIQGGQTGLGLHYGYLPSGKGAPSTSLSGGNFSNTGILVGGNGGNGADAALYLRQFSPNHKGYDIAEPQGGSQGGDGVDLSGGGIFYNAVQGTIAGGIGGLGGAGGTFSFPGSPEYAGITLTVNAPGGSGGQGGEGVFLADGTLVNHGLIYGGAGGGGGIYTGTPGKNGDEVLSGSYGGTMGQNGAGVIIASGVLENAGTIAGVVAVSFIGAGTLIADAGAKFGGQVLASTTASDVLILSGTSATEALIGTEFQNFTGIDLAQGAAWTIGGSLAQLETISFSGLTAGDTINVFGFSATSETYVSGVGLELTNATSTITLSVNGGLNGAVVAAVAANAPCLCAGTHIRTPGGEVPVESLQIGGVVETAFSGPQRIKWIGRRDYEGRFIESNHRALPVCFKAGAIADGIPSRNLWVSPDHAICEGGVLIHAWRLVNGISIIQAASVEHVSYLHVELDAHDIIFAENCPTESFLDVNCRQRFHNAAEFATLYGESKPGITCLPLVQSGFHLHNIQQRIAKRAGIMLQASPPGTLRGNLDEINSIRLHGWAQDMAAPEEPVCLDIFVAGSHIGKVLANGYRSDLRAAGLGSGCHAFEFVLPTGCAGSLLGLYRASDGVSLTLEARIRAA